MAAPPRRWFRLDVGWSDSEWLAALEPAARLAWIELLGYVKSTGLAGTAKAVPAVVFGRNRGIPAEAVTAMLAAAVADGALESDGRSWRIVKWADYQEPDPTAAARQRKHRAERSRLSPLRRDTVTDRDQPVTNGVTRRVTETETETEKKKTRAVAAGAARVSEVFQKAWEAYPTRTGSNSKQAAWAAWQARLKHGATEEEMLAGTLRYRDFCHAEGQTGTRYVMQASRFYGARCEYAAAWKPTPPEAGKPRPGSEAAAVRDELPRSTAPRTGPDPLEERRKQEADDRRRVAAWTQEHPAEARTIMAQVKAFLDAPEWREVPASVREATGAEQYAKRVLEKLRPVAA